MRKAWLVVAVVALVGLGLGAGRAASQDMGGEGKEVKGQEGSGGTPAPGPSPEEMVAWVKYMTPGPEHEKLAGVTGEWNAAVRMWMMPGAPVIESTGSAKFRMVFGGRYQVQEFTGTMGGMPFEGMSVVGFDNAKKEYVSTWIDSSGTGIILARGKADDKGVVTRAGKMTNPMMTADYDTREVITLKDKDTMVFEWFMSGGSYKEEFRLMEITYTRKKP